MKKSRITLRDAILLIVGLTVITQYKIFGDLIAEHRYAAVLAVLATIILVAIGTSFLLFTILARVLARSE